ncbi:MAG TPA: phage holin family protein [Steroidobacteraceae bacterium]|jgi:uncharacterized membrane protein YqjE
MIDPPGRAAGPAINRFLDSLGQLLITAVEMVHTRLELVFTELQEALESLLGLIVWWLVTLAAGALSLLFGGLALIFVFWDTHRVLVAVLITSVFVLMTLVAGSIVLAKLRQQRSLFATTLTELAKDRAFLKAPP